MPAADKDIKGKIVDFLRQRGGKAIINASRKKAKEFFDCWDSSLTFALNKLQGAGVVRFCGKEHVRYNLYELLPEFLEGDGWREALKRKSSGGKSEAGPGVTVDCGASEQPTPTKIAENEPCNEECLRARRVLLGELVEIFEKLKASQEENRALHSQEENRALHSQEENRALHSTVAELQKKVENLEGEIESKKNACRQLRNDVDQLESRLRTLRTQTLQLPAEKKLRFDKSGVMILPDEELPDTR